MSVSTKNGTAATATATAEPMATITQGKVAGGLIELPAYISAPPASNDVTVDGDIDTTSPMIEVTTRFTDTADSTARARRAFNAVSRVQPPVDKRPTTGAVVSIVRQVRTDAPIIKDGKDVTPMAQRTYGSDHLTDVPFVVLATDTHNESPELWAVKLRMTFVDPATSKPYAREATVNARAFTSLTVRRRNPNYLPPAWAGGSAIGRDPAPDATDSK